MRATGQAEGKAVDSAGSVLRRKAAAGRVEPATGVEPVTHRAFRQALGRAAQAVPGLDLRITALTEVRYTLAEVLELPPERALLAMVEGPGEGLGLMVLAPVVLTTLIEVQTMGRPAPGLPVARRPTRTDAAMAAGLIDRVLAALAEALEDTPDRTWTAGFRYASYLDDARPLDLLLDDAPFRVFRATVAFAPEREGQVILALPAAGRALAPASPAAAVGPAPPPPPATLAEAGLAVPAELTAVLHRLTLPLAAVLALKPGDTLALPGAALERIALEGLDGRGLGEGKLGQNRGNRAVRLALLPGAASTPPPMRAAAG